VVWRSIYAYFSAWNFQISEIEADEPIPAGVDFDMIVCGTAWADRLSEENLKKSLLIRSGSQAPDPALRALPVQARISDLRDRAAQILKRQDVMAAKRVAVPVAVDGPQYPGARVLVVEDNSTNQMVISALLKKFGIECRVIDDGEAAVPACVNEHFDLVLMDCQMARMDGLEATRQIRQFKNMNQLPIVAVTANAMREDREMCVLAGMNDFLAKPVRRAEVAAVLEKYLPVSSGNTTKAS
jgi:CheY-like chemotaxis protein